MIWCLVEKKDAADKNENISLAILYMQILLNTVRTVFVTIKRYIEIQII